ncbi:hypothetical protein PGTUg99_008979 [Puccinia graminis f. sp. tritici]|uniref:Uncharacterized protein n=1 Tax=Puccinia graminis f. sp. tritici TaxID=56615 RepID=A0A5B0MZV3_PUCGR|nr:hypothetical protein PGTUg99_008979 [Puccinia graminis f. sp. tritici]
MEDFFHCPSIISLSWIGILRVKTCCKNLFLNSVCVRSSGIQAGNLYGMIPVHRDQGLLCRKMVWNGAKSILKSVFWTNKPNIISWPQISVLFPLGVTSSLNFTSAQSLE